MASPSDAGSAPRKKGGLLGLILPILLLTVLAAGGGAMIGMQIVAAVKRSVLPEVKAAATAAAKPVDDTTVRELAPIVTNLAAPDEASWVRLQAAVVYSNADAPQIQLMTARIADDLTAFLRTLNLSQLQGANGLQHLREDLNERVNIRTDGHVHDLIIEMLVIQ